jgi:hypothetical protein
MYVVSPKRTYAFTLNWAAERLNNATNNEMAEENIQKNTCSILLFLCEGLRIVIKGNLLPNTKEKQTRVNTRYQLNANIEKNTNNVISV